MQTRTYGDLFSLITNLVGAVELAPDEQTQIGNFVNRRFQEAFDESAIWPRYLVISEERDINALTLSGATSDTSTSVNQNYKLLGSNTSGGTDVYQGVTTSTVIIYNTGSAWRIDTSASATKQSDGSYTVSAGTQQFIEADSDKKDDVAAVETFTPRAGSDVLAVDEKQLIPYAETNKTTIGDFNRIHRKKAFLNNSAVEYEFFVDADGANILNIISGNDNTAFISYKKQFTPFTVSSDYYNSSAEVPAEFFNFIAHTVYADFLRVQNKQEEAIAEEQIGRTYLNLELEKVDIKMNNTTINKRFSTYVNRQAR
jgi:hypothetical protein